MLKKSSLSLFLLLMFCFPASGEQAVSGAQKKLGQLQGKIKDADNELKELQRQQHNLNDQLKNLETQYGQVAHSVKTLQADITQLREVIRDINRKIAGNRDSINTQKDALASLVRSAYAVGAKDRLKVIFNQQDPASFNRMLVYYDYLNQDKLQKVQILEQNFLALKQLELEQRQKDDVLAKALQHQQQKQHELQSLKSERKKLIAQLQKRYADKKTQLSQLKGGEQKLKQLIVSLRQRSVDYGDESLNSFTQTKPFALLRGSLPWPLKGRLQQKFGGRRAEGRWDGVLINAKEGAPIHAVARGRIVYADWLRGYGLLIIIDHGKEFMTLYAFNQSLYKSVGEKVEAGDVIASVGSSGGRSESALYFGIRKKGKPVDPVRWCRKIHKNRVG